MPQKNSVNFCTGQKTFIRVLSKTETLLEGQPNVLRALPQKVTRKKKKIKKNVNSETRKICLTKQFLLIGSTQVIAQFPK